MNSFSLRSVLRSRRSAFVCAILCVTHLLPWSWASGQDTRAALDVDRLRAAVEEARQSPFYGPETPVVSTTGVALGYLAPVPVTSPARAAQAAEGDSTFSTGRVLLMSFGAAALSDVVAFYFGLCAAYGGGGGCLDSDALSLVGAITTPVLGTAAGARLGGAPFLPALAGSAAGFGLVLLQFAMGAFVDPDDSFVLFVALPAVLQAGITTLIVSAFG